MEPTRFPPYDADFDICALRSEPFVMYVKFIHDLTTNKALFRFVFEYYSRQVDTAFESASNKITTGKFEYLVPTLPFFVVNVKLCRGFQGEERFHKEEWLSPKERDNELINHETSMKSELLGRYRVHVQSTFHHHYRRGHTETIFGARAVNQTTGRVYIVKFDVTAHHTDHFPVLKKGPGKNGYKDESDSDPDPKQRVSRSRRSAKRSRNESADPVSQPAWAPQMNQPVQTFTFNQSTASESHPAWTQQMQQTLQPYAIIQNTGSESQLGWTQPMQQPVQSYTMNQNVGSESNLAWTQQLHQSVQSYTMNQNDSFTSLPVSSADLYAAAHDAENPLQFPVLNQPVFLPGAEDMTQKYQISQSSLVIEESADLPADEDSKLTVKSEETGLQ